MIIIYRYSYLSCLLSDKKISNNKDLLGSYLLLCNVTWLIDFDVSKLPIDYDGNNYDLIFDNDYNFVKAELDLNISDSYDKE
jgi:hypothetical protein